MQILKEMHTLFWNNNGYLIIYIICLCFFVWKKEKEQKVYDSLFLYSLILLIFIIYNPVFIKIACKVFFESALEYVRMFFLLPMYAMMAYVISEIVTQVKSKKSKVFFVVLCVGMIAITGQTYGELGCYIVPQNIYKIGDESIEISNMILEDSSDMASVLIDTDGRDIVDCWGSGAGNNTNLLAGIRQYTSRIKFVDCFLSKEEYQSADFEGMYAYLKSIEDIDYQYIICRNSTDIVGELITAGFEKIGNTENYVVMKRPEELKESTIKCVEQKELVMSDVSKEYNIIIVNDAHLICLNEEIALDKKETITNRYYTFSVNRDGLPSSELWAKMAQEINNYEPDLVVFAGDMVDFATAANIECLKEGMSKIKSPILYIRADHDYHWKWSRNLTEEEAYGLQQTVDENPDVWRADMGECLVVGIDSSTAQVSEQMLCELNKIFKEGKPIIFVTHVPIDSLVDSGLEQTSIEKRGISLIWGENDNYRPNETTQELLDMIYAEDTPVEVVVAAHLHSAYDVKLTEKGLMEYVFAPAFEGNIGIIHVVPGGND